MLGDRWRNAEKGEELPSEVLKAMSTVFWIVREIFLFSLRPALAAFLLGFLFYPKGDTFLRNVFQLHAVTTQNTASSRKRSCLNNILKIIHKPARNTHEISVLIIGHYPSSMFYARNAKFWVLHLFPFSGNNVIYSKKSIEKKCLSYWT